MVEVETLNLSKTFLTRLSGLEGMAKLSTLNLRRRLDARHAMSLRITTLDGISEKRLFPGLTFFRDLRDQSRS